VGFDALGGEFEVGVGVDGDGFSAEEVYEVFVHDEVGVCEENFVVGVYGGHECEEESAGYACGDHGVLEGCAEFVGVVLAACVAQGLASPGLGVGYRCLLPQESA